MAILGTNLATAGGGGGAIVSEAVAAALTTLSIVPSSNVSYAQGTVNPFRPPQWARPALTSITVPPASSGATYDANGVLHTTTRASTVYVFDAVLRLSHLETITKTKHAVQTGANISDHAYVNAARVTLEIGMSDAMASYSTGMWTASGSKSVAAWQAMKRIKDARLPVTLSTRLATYTNMLIESMEAPDDNTTRYGLRATITFEQIFTATLAATQVSARPQTTDSTGNGAKQADAPTAALTDQHQLPSPLFPNVSAAGLQSGYGAVPNAGSWSSNSLGTLPTGSN